MEYSVNKLANVAGVSGRTLRYYDQIGLLKPKRINSSGYRIYGEMEVDRLHQILFYRTLGMELEQIKALIDAPDFDRLGALENHIVSLREEKKRIEILIKNAGDTIKHMKGEVIMSDKEKFEGFKRNLIEENERKYGKEIREKYGDEAVDTSNANMMNMTQQDYQRMQELGEEVLKTLVEAFKTGDPAGELADKTCELHKEWLSMCGAPYSKEYHRGLGQMYVDDSRFTAYYDSVVPGGSEFLRDAINIFCSKDE